MYFPTDSVRLLTKDEMAYISELVSGWTMFQLHFCDSHLSTKESCLWLHYKEP